MKWIFRFLPRHLPQSRKAVFVLRTHRTWVRKRKADRKMGPKIAPPKKESFVQPPCFAAPHWWRLLTLLKPHPHKMVLPEFFFRCAQCIVFVSSRMLPSQNSIPLLFAQWCNNNFKQKIFTNRAQPFPPTQNILPPTFNLHLTWGGIRSITADMRWKGTGRWCKSPFRRNTWLPVLEYRPTQFKSSFPFLSLSTDRSCCCGGDQ